MSLPVTVFGCLGRGTLKFCSSLDVARSAGGKHLQKLTPDALPIEVFFTNVLPRWLYAIVSS